MRDAEKSVVPRIPHSKQFFTFDEKDRLISAPSSFLNDGYDHEGDE